MGIGFEMQTPSYGEGGKLGLLHNTAGFIMDKSNHHVISAGMDSLDRNRRKKVPQTRASAYAAGNNGVGAQAMAAEWAASAFLQNT